MLGCFQLNGWIPLGEWFGYSIEKSPGGLARLPLNGSAPPANQCVTPFCCETQVFSMMQFCTNRRKQTMEGNPLPAEHGDNQRWVSRLASSTSRRLGGSWAWSHRMWRNGLKVLHAHCNCDLYWFLHRKSTDEFFVANQSQSSVELPKL